MFFHVSGKKLPGSGSGYKFNNEVFVQSKHQNAIRGHRRHCHNFHRIRFLFHFNRGAVMSLHMLHEVGLVGKHFGAQVTSALTPLPAMQALVLHVRHMVPEGLGAMFTAEGGRGWGDVIGMLPPRVSP